MQIQRWLGCWRLQTSWNTPVGKTFVLWYGAEADDDVDQEVRQIIKRMKYYVNSRCYAEAKDLT